MPLINTFVAWSIRWLASLFRSGNDRSMALGHTYVDFEIYFPVVIINFLRDRNYHETNNFSNHIKFPNRIPVYLIFLDIFDESDFLFLTCQSKWSNIFKLAFVYFNIISVILSISLICFEIKIYFTSLAYFSQWNHNLYYCINVLVRYKYKIKSETTPGYG